MLRNSCGPERPQSEGPYCRSGRIFQDRHWKKIIKYEIKINFQIKIWVFLPSANGEAKSFQVAFEGGPESRSHSVVIFWIAILSGCFFQYVQLPITGRSIFGRKKKISNWTSSRLIFWLIDLGKKIRTERSAPILSSPHHILATLVIILISWMITRHQVFFIKRENGARRRHCHDNKCDDNRRTLITTEMTPMSHPSEKNSRWRKSLFT